MRGGGGFGGGGFRGGGFVGGGFRGGFGGFRGGFGRYGYGYGYWPWAYAAWGYPYWGLGLGWGGGYWPDSYSYPDYPYDSGYGGYASYGGYPAYGGYAGYQTSPNVTVVYPPPAPQTAHPVIREYDEYGQEIVPNGAGGVANGASSAAGSNIYLIAFNDHVIRAAIAYWVDGATLHYVSTQHEEHTVPLNTVDRTLSSQLNRERQVPFQLPGQ
jgi:hypothetical protein